MPRVSARRGRKPVYRKKKYVKRKVVSGMTTNVKKRVPIRRRQSLANRISKLEKYNKVNTDIKWYSMAHGWDQIVNVNVSRLTTPSTWTRIFAGTVDTITNNSCMIKRIIIDIMYSPKFGTGSTSTITPYNEPIYLRSFLVSPKWAYRNTVSSSTTTLVNSADLTNGVHYSYPAKPTDVSTVSTSMPLHWAPIINTEFFKIYGYIDYKWQPTVFATSEQTQPYAMPPIKSKRIAFKPYKFYLNGKNTAWSSMNDDDIPFSKQLYVITIAHNAATSGQTIYFNVDIATRFEVSELSNR